MEMNIDKQGDESCHEIMTDHKDHYSIYTAIAVGDCFWSSTILVRFWSSSGPKIETTSPVNFWTITFSDRFLSKQDVNCEHAGPLASHYDP